MFDLKQKGWIFCGACLLCVHCANASQSPELTSFSLRRRGATLAEFCGRFEGNNMRLSMLALILILICAAGAVLAQTVIDADTQKVPPPREQDQGQAQSEVRPSTQTQENPQANSASRFSFSRIENGFMRLDNNTGEVAYCSAQTVGWTCKTVPIDRESAGNDPFLKDLKTEIARLQEEITSLKKEIAALKAPLPLRPPTDLTPPSDKGPDATIKLPTADEIARVRDYIEGVWRRLVEMIVTTQKDLMRKN